MSLEVGIEPSGIRWMVGGKIGQKWLASKSYVDFLGQAVDTSKGLEQVKSRRLQSVKSGPSLLDSLF
jgi:hypothetical protein